MIDGSAVFTSIAVVFVVFLLLFGLHCFVMDIADDIKAWLGDLTKRTGKPRRQRRRHKNNLSKECQAQLSIFQSALRRPKIEQLRNGEPIYIDPPEETATDIRFVIECPSSIKVRHINETLDVTARNVSKPGGPRRIEWTVAKTNTKTPSWPEIMASVHLEPFECVVGLDKQHNPLMFTVDQFPSLAIFGDSGAGKTFAVHSLLCSLIARHDPEQLRLVIMDSKQARAGQQRNYAPYKDLPHVERYYDDVEQLPDCIAFAESFLGQLEAGQTLILLLEELPLLQPYFDDETKSRLSNITRTGRELGVCAIVTSQSATKSAIPAGVVDMFPSRILLKLRHESELYQADSLTTEITDITRLKKSHGYAIIDGGDPQKIAIPRFSDSDRAQVIQSIAEEYPIPPIPAPEQRRGEGMGSRDREITVENTESCAGFAPGIVESYKALKSQGCPQREIKAKLGIGYNKLKRLDTLIKTQAQRASAP